MAVTVKTNARGWREVSTTAFWTARCLWDTGSALYAVVQDTGATPKVRVLKADDRFAPTAFAEQDSGNNKTISSVDRPFSSWLHSDGLIHIAVFTATNTITHYTFDTATDTWGAGNGNATTGAQNERSIRLVVRSDGDILIFYTDSTDDADLAWTRWEPSAWTVGIAVLAGTSTEASTYVDVVIDSTDRAYPVYMNCAADALQYRSINSVNSLGTATAIDLPAASAETAHPAGGRYSLYDDGGTEKIIAAYIDSDGTLKESVLTLESNSGSGNVAANVSIEATAGDVGTRTPASTAVVVGVPYAAWWDDASSGTIKYSTKSAGSWATETDFATSITRLIEIAPVANGLAVVYQSGSDVVMDFVVVPNSSVPASLTVTPATASAADEAVTLDAASKLTVTEATAPAAGQAVTLKGQGRLTVTAAEAPAAGQAVTLDAASLFTVAAAAAPAAGGTVALTGQGRLPITAATAPATAQNVTLTAAAKLTVTPSAAPAQGEAVNLAAAAAATLIVTPATAAAAAQTVALAGQGALAVTAATAPAAGEAVTFDAAARLTVTQATAPAQGEAVALTAGVAAALTVTPATAAAAGQAVTLDSAARLTVATATAAAQGEAVTLDVAANLIAGTATAPAAGGTIALTGQGRLALGTATAPAEGENVSLFGGTSIPGTLSVAPATSAAQGEAVSFDAGAVFAVAPATAPAQGAGVTLTAAALMAIAAAVADATGANVSLTGQGTLAIAPPNAAAAADSALHGAARFAIDAALADALALGNLTGGSLGDLTARLLVFPLQTASLRLTQPLTGRTNTSHVVHAGLEIDFDG